MKVHTVALWAALGVVVSSAAALAIPMPAGGTGKGGGSTALRTEHNYLPFGGAQAPSPYAAALFQEQFKNREFIRHCDCSLVLGLVSFELVVGSKVYSKSGRTA